MFILDSESLPADGEQLGRELTAGLGQYFRLPAGRVVEVRGKPPNLDELTVDLGGVFLDGLPQALPAPSGRAGPALTVTRLRLTAQPLHYEQAPLFVELTAREVRLLPYARPGGGLVLVPAGAEEGCFHGRVARESLRDLLLASARQAARREGVVVTGAGLELTQPAGHSIQVVLHAEGTRKVLFSTLRWSVELRGRLEIDDGLVASVTGLSFRGEGAMGMLIASKLEEHFREAGGYRLPLAGLPVGGLRVRDLTTRAGKEGLELEAAFGG